MAVAHGKLYLGITLRGCPREKVPCNRRPSRDSTTSTQKGKRARKLVGEREIREVFR